MVDAIEFRLHHKPVQLNVDGERKLLWVLRSDLNLTGTNQKSPRRVPEIITSRLFF